MTAIRLVVLAALVLWGLADDPWYVRALALVALVVVEIGTTLGQRKVVRRSGLKPVSGLATLRTAWHRGFSPFEAWVLLMLRRNGHMDVKPGTKGDRAIEALAGAGLATFGTSAAAGGYRAYPS